MTITARPAATTGIPRFRKAQDQNWYRISRELASGVKQTHWMWYVFPQLKGLAKSETARRFGIADKAEALAYLDDPVLRLRLGQSTMAVLNHRLNMFGDTDRKKLRSCMTLFRELVTDPTLPNAVLEKFYGGEPDPLTLDLLAGRPIPDQWPKPKPFQWSAQGRVETKAGRYWEKQIRKAQAAVEAVGQPPLWAEHEPMSYREIESFLKGFGLSSAATRQIVDRWVEDQNRANQQGWDSANAELYG